MTSNDLLMSMWGILAAAWLLATGLRALLIYLAWPDERVSRTLMTLASAAFTVFFIWRISLGPPEEASQVSYVRNYANFFFVVCFNLDAIWAIKGVLERRARRASLHKKGGEV